MKLNELQIGQTLKIETKTSYGYTETMTVTLTSKSRNGFKAQTEAGTKLRIIQTTLDNPRNTITVL